MSFSKPTLLLLKKKLHLLLFLWGAVAVFLLCFGVYDYFWADERKFDVLCDSLFTKFYERDALSLAFSFQDAPSGIDAFPLYHKETYLFDNSLEEYAKALGAIRKSKLKKSDAALYEILTDYFTLHEQDSRFLYMEEPLSPTGGAQTNLPVLLAEYPVSKKEDIEAYLTLLEAIPAYFEGLCAYEKDRKEAGYLMATQDMEAVILQCDEMCSPAGEALFMESFSALLEEVSPELSEAEKDLYEARCHRIVTTLVFPAFKAMGDALLLLKEEDVAQQGLFYTRHPQYYAYLMEKKTGSDKTVAQLEALLQKRFGELAKDLNQALAKLPEDLSFSFAQELGGEVSLLEMSNQFLLSLQDEMSKDFPPLPDGVLCEVKNVPNCLLPYTAPAYFFMPQINAFRENTIYLNGTDLSDLLSLFTTLAHEGYPGHMLQSTYFLALSAENPLERGKKGIFEEIPLSQKKTALRTCLGYVGYIEGWAMYVEFLSYQYATLMDSSISGELAQFYELLRLNRELKICLYCLLDIRVHGYGDGPKELAPYLENIGITQTESVQALYTYLVHEPCTYAAYYVGFLELLECKELYQAQCKQAGVAYTQKGFHTFYLSVGPCSFPYLKRQIATAFLPPT